MLRLPRDLVEVLVEIGRFIGRRTRQLLEDEALYFDQDASLAVKEIDIGSQAVVLAIMRRVEDGIGIGGLVGGVMNPQ